MSFPSLPAMWMRGGTSKGLFFHSEDLPADRSRWNALFLAALGSPDPFGNQLDGLGGATPATSKVAVVGPSAREDCDVDYFFARVGITEAIVDSSGNCGNLSAAVGPFAVHAGLIRAGRLRSAGDAVTVRIWQENLGRRIDVRVPLAGGEVTETGHCHIDGVRGSGAAIQVDYPLPGGGEQGAVLPTGRPMDELAVNGHSYPATLIDAGHPTVFVLAKQFGLQGSEGRDELATQRRTLEALDALRAAAAQRLDGRSPGVVLIGPPQDYPTPKGNWVWAEGIRLSARLLLQGRPHHAFTDTGALALAVAAQIPGSLVQQLTRPPGEAISFGHASGLMRVSARVRQAEAGWVAESAGLERTARRLMAGRVFLPEGLEEP